MSEAQWEEWLATRPESVRKLALEFPPGTNFVHDDGTRVWVIGYQENDVIIGSYTNPMTDYEGAMKDKVYAHAQCVRDQIRKNS